MAATTVRWYRGFSGAGGFLARWSGAGALTCLLVSANGQPANDNFANRTTIPRSHVVLTNSLAGATAEPGEPLISDVASGQTAWWTWTAPSNGIVSISVAGMIGNTLVTVFTGNELSTLSLVASNNYQSCYQYCGCHWRERDSLSFHAAKGQVYQLAVDSAIVIDAHMEFVQGSGLNQPMGVVLVESGTQTVWTTNVVQGGAYQLSFDFTPAPKNDDFSRATKLVGSRSHLKVSNAGATKEAGEPDLSGNPGGSSVWYSWKAPASGRVLISTNTVAPYLPPSWGTIGVIVVTLPGVNIPTCGDEIDQNPPPVFFPIFGAYTGDSLETLTPSDYQPFALGDIDNAIVFDAIKNQTYQIAFDGNMGTTGAVDMHLMLTTPAVNDSFERRIKTHGLRIVASGYNAGATHQAGEPVLGKTVWWSWIAPATGTASLTLDGSDFTFPVGVFTGSTVKTLTPVATGSGYLTFDAVAGQAYQIAVADAAGLTGAIRLSITGAVVEATLTRALKTGKAALLTYSALQGQTLLLQRSADASNWTDVRTALSHGNGTSFQVSPPPAANGPFYRAIIVDLVR